MRQFVFLSHLSAYNINRGLDDKSNESRSYFTVYEAFIMVKILALNRLRMHYWRQCVCEHK